MKERNGNVPEPLRSILNAASPSVIGTDPLFPSFGHDPEIDRGFDDDMFDGDGDPDEGCTNKGGHSFVTADTDNGGDGRSYCEFCLADGDA